MKNHRKIITVLVALTALVSAQKTYGMKRITNFFSGSSKKEDSRPSREDSSTRPTPSRGSDSRFSSRQTPQELNRTLGELFPGESSRSSSRSGSRESKSSREATKEIEISSPTGFRKTTDDTLSRMKPEDAKMIRDAQAQQTQDVQLKNSIKQAQEAMKLNTQAELKDQEARRSRLDRAIESKPQQSTTESKQRLISEKESRVQELGSKIQAERSKDLSPEEKIESKKIIAQYEKEIMGINKSIREARENERIAKLTPDEHKAEIEQLRQKINERKKEYAMVEKSGDETNIKTAKKEIQRAEAKAKLAEIKLEERLAPQEAESLKKTTGPKKSVTFNEVIETSDNKPKKVYDPEAVPVKGILKKPTESSDASPTTKPVEAKTQETLELSPAMKRKMEAAQKAFETQELKTMTPAMQKRMEAEQKSFENRNALKKPTVQEEPAITVAPKKSARLSDVVETSDNTPNNAYNSAAVPVSGILKTTTKPPVGTPATSPSQPQPESDSSQLFYPGAGLTSEGKPKIGSWDSMKRAVNVKDSPKEEQRLLEKIRQDNLKLIDDEGKKTPSKPQ